jgi:ABC-type transporter Mla MlaB component
MDTALPKIERESAAKKKQRMRSDAALMRQDRFGLYSREDVVNIYRTFRKLDQDQSGSITLQELFGGAGLFSGTHMQDNIASIFSSVDEDQSGQIELPELCRAVFADASAADLADISRLCELLDAVDKSRKAKKKQLSPEQLKELEELFKVGHAFVIDYEELRHAWCSLRWL